MITASDYEKMADECERIAARIGLAEESAQLRAFATRLRREADALRRREQARGHDEG